MTIGKFALSAMLASACFAGSAFGQQARVSPYKTVAYSDAAACNCGPSATAVCDGSSSCDAMGCYDGSCDSGCGLLGGGLLGGLGECCLGEPWELCDGRCGWDIGGWSNVGYFTEDTACFNTYEDRVQLQQQWFYAEKVADGTCGLDVGGRIDYLYGTDGPDTQAFGTNDDSFDNSWDNGTDAAGRAIGYGHAMPQLYGEVAYGNLSAKVGHFFTIIGNEVVAATGNFFYSRQFTFYNSEPFTHTGVLTNYAVNDDFNLWNGYVMGWDSGFEDNGDAYIGGFSRTLNDYTRVIGSTVVGRFSDNALSTERGELTSVVFTTQLTDNLTHISQSDYLDTENGRAGGIGRNTWGNINYLIYQMSDCLAFGQRFEYYNVTRSDFLDRGIKNADTYNYTTGFNYRPTANLTWRPEVRFIWDRERIGLIDNNFGNSIGPAGGNRGSLAVFGNDLVFTY